MRATFEAGRGFPLDRFQRLALDALDAGQSVLVAAPTGSGKTLVAEYAIDQARADGGKVFYTTPLKALSNQKYGDLVRVHGATTVGLLTGDNSVNGDAPIVVMTTEVLRNMIYAASPALDGLRYVVLDEVHYLQDRYRGPVWEEVIVHLPARGHPRVPLGDGVERRGGGGVDRDRARAAPRRSSRSTARSRSSTATWWGSGAPTSLHLLPTFVAAPDGELRPNPEAARLDARNARDPGWRGRPRTRLRTPSRVETAELLAAESMLPAIAFVFSRTGCDQAVEQCLAAGLRLTEPGERARIRAIADAKTAGLADDDLDVLGYDQWLAGLEAGFAAHHAGMVPPMKEAVEEAFAAGLVEGGVRHRDARARHQHAGALGGHREALEVHRRAPRVPHAGRVHAAHRAGRAARHRRARLRDRVLEPVRALRPGRVAGVAPQRRAALVVPADVQHGRQPRAPLHASSRPTTCSTCRSRSSTPTATSWPSSASSTAPSEQLARQRELIGADLDAVQEYRVARHRASTRCAATSGERPPHHRGDGGPAARRRRRGAAPRAAGSWCSTTSTGAAAAAGWSRSRPGVTSSASVRRTSTAPPRRAATIDLPEPFAPRNPAFRRQAAERLRRVEAARRRRAHAPGGAPAGRARGRAAPTHPLSGDPQREQKLRAAAALERFERDVQRIERRVRGRSESLARQFDRVLRVLEAWGYVDGWQLTDAGELLARLYTETDLLLAEALREGLLDGLRPPELAAVVSCFTYERRGPEGQHPMPPARWPTKTVAKRARAVERHRGGPARQRGRRRAPRDPAARSRVHAVRVRLGRGRLARRRARRRRDHRRRLRPAREAVHRPAPPGRRRRARPRDPRAGPRGRRRVPPRRRRGVERRGRADGDRVVEKGRAVGAAGVGARRVARRAATTPRSPPRCGTIPAPGSVPARRRRPTSPGPSGSTAGPGRPPWSSALDGLSGPRRRPGPLRGEHGRGRRGARPGRLAHPRRPQLRVAGRRAGRPRRPGDRGRGRQRPVPAGHDVVPRGHPGDGRVEVQVYAVRPGQRAGVRSRLPQGVHLPHPDITQTGRPPRRGPGRSRRGGARGRRRAGAARGARVTVEVVPGAFLLVV